MPFAVTWMDLEIIILSEESQTEEDKYHMTSLICGILKNDTNELIYVQNRNRDIENKLMGTSLVAQWLRICLPLQGTQVRFLVQEDPTCRGAAKPVRHNC